MHSKLNVIGPCPYAVDCFPRCKFHDSVGVRTVGGDRRVLHQLPVHAAVGYSSRSQFSHRCLHRGDEQRRHGDDLPTDIGQTGRYNKNDILAMLLKYIFIYLDVICIILFSLEIGIIMFLQLFSAVKLLRQVINCYLVIELIHICNRQKPQWLLAGIIGVICMCLLSYHMTFSWLVITEGVLRGG